MSNRPKSDDTMPTVAAMGWSGQKTRKSILAISLLRRDESPKQVTRPMYQSSQLSKTVCEWACFNL